MDTEVDIEKIQLIANEALALGYILAVNSKDDETGNLEFTSSFLILIGDALDFLSSLLEFDESEEVTSEDIFEIVIGLSEVILDFKELMEINKK